MKKFTNLMMITGLIILLSSCGVTTKKTMWASPTDSPKMEIMKSQTPYAFMYRPPDQPPWWLLCFEGVCVLPSSWPLARVEVGVRAAVRATTLC